MSWVVRSVLPFCWWSQMGPGVEDPIPPCQARPCLCVGSTRAPWRPSASRALYAPSRRACLGLERRRAASRDSYADLARKASVPRADDLSSWAYADASAHRCGRMRRHWRDDKEGARDRAESPIDPLRGGARLGQRRHRHGLGAERGGGARKTEHIQSRPHEVRWADDLPSIGRPATNMRCAKCGQTFSATPIERCSPTAPASPSRRRPSEGGDAVVLTPSGARAEASAVTRERGAADPAPVPVARLPWE